MLTSGGAFRLSFRYTIRAERRMRVDTGANRWGVFREIRESHEKVGIAADGHPAGKPGVTPIGKSEPGSIVRRVPPNSGPFLGLFPS